MTQPDVPPAPRSDVLCAPWASPADVPERYRPLLSNAEWEQVLMLASEILWMLSGRRFNGGGCEETVVLRSAEPTPGRGAWPYHPSWGKCACLRYPMERPWLRGHYSPVAVRLPRSPITAVTAVTINGQPFTDFRMIRAGWVERTDGKSWPMCDDTAQITYEYGDAPPEGGVMAAVDLAVQIALDWSGSDDCQLPQRVTSVTRQGVSMTVLDPQDFLTDGRTGLYLVDLWLAAVNPSKRGRAGRVWSPDVPMTSWS